MIILGIDPGITGAIAVFQHGAFRNVYDIPVVRDTNKSKQRLDLSALLALIDDTTVEHCVMMSECECYMEQAHAMPKQGVSSMFNYGRTNGLIEGILVGHGVILPKKVVPAVWKRRLSLLSNSHPKDASLKKARALYPEAPLNLKKHHNRAEAILIGHYGCLMEGERR